MPISRAPIAAIAITGLVSAACVFPGRHASPGAHRTAYLIDGLAIAAGAVAVGAELGTGGGPHCSGPGCATGFWIGTGLIAVGGLAALANAVLGGPDPQPQSYGALPRSAGDFGAAATARNP